MNTQTLKTLSINFIPSIEGCAPRCELSNEDVVIKIYVDEMYNTVDFVTIVNGEYLDNNKATNLFSPGDIFFILEQAVNYAAYRGLQNISWMPTCPKRDRIYKLAAKRAGYTITHDNDGYPTIAIEPMTLIQKEITMTLNQDHNDAIINSQAIKELIMNNDLNDILNSLTEKHYDSLFTSEQAKTNIEAIAKEISSNGYDVLVGGTALTHNIVVTEHEPVDVVEILVLCDDLAQAKKDLSGYTENLKKDFFSNSPTVTVHLGRGYVLTPIQGDQVLPITYNGKLFSKGEECSIVSEGLLKVLSRRNIELNVNLDNLHLVSPYGYFSLTSDLGRAYNRLLCDVSDKGIRFDVDAFDAVRYTLNITEEVSKRYHSKTLVSKVYSVMHPHELAYSDVPEGVLEYTTAIVGYLNFITESVYNAFTMVATERAIIATQGNIEFLTAEIALEAASGYLQETARDYHNQSLRILQNMERALFDYAPKGLEGWDVMRVLDLEAQEQLVLGKKRLAYASKCTTTRGCRDLVKQKYLNWLKLSGFSKVVEKEVDIFIGYTPFADLIYHSSYSAGALKPKNLPKGIDVSNFLSYAKWSLVIGANNLDNLSYYYVSHSMFITGEEAPIPEKFKSPISKDHKMLGWIFEKQLKVDWTVSNSPRQCIVEALKNTYSLSEESAKLVYENSSLIEAQDFAMKHDNSDIEITPVLTSMVLPEGVEFLDKHDLLNLMIGQLPQAGSCQYLGGVGEQVCKQGWLDELSANLVFKSDSGNIIGYAWTWVGSQGEIVLDSVEGSEDSALIEKVAHKIMELVSLNEDKTILISCTDYGMTNDVRNIVRDSFEVSYLNTYSPKPVVRYIYSDVDNCGGYASMLSDGGVREFTNPEEGTYYTKSIYVTNKVYEDNEDDSYIPF